MAKGKGYQSIVGLRKASTWGTAVACGAGHGLEVLTVGLKADRGIVSDMSITGTVSQRQGDKGNIVAGGDIVLPMRYEGIGQLLAAVLGTAGAPSTVDTTGKKHIYRPAATTDGIFWTLAYEILKDAVIYEFDSVKITGFSIKATIPGRIELTVRAIAKGFTDASAINTTTTIDTITQSANLEIAQARQLVVRLNAQTGGALGASDAKYLTAFELNVDRPLEADFTTEFGDSTSEPMPPSGDAFLKVGGVLTFSQYDNGGTGGNSPFPLEQYNRTLKKMDWTLTGDNLAGAATSKYQFVGYHPMVVFGEGKPTLAAGALGWSIPFTAHHVSAIPTGFPTGYVEAVVIENVNQGATDVLA